MKKKKRYWLLPSRINIVKLKNKIDNGVYKSEFGEITAKNAIYRVQLKKNITPAEKIFGDYLWRETTIKFIFQKGFFKPFHRIYDFYIPKRRLAFEIDGSSHNGKEDKDKRKDTWYKDERGITTIRITNEEVYSGSFKVVLKQFFNKNQFIKT